MFFDTVQNATPVLLIGGLLIVLSIVIRWSKNQHNGFFNFKKDLAEANAPKPKIPKITDDKTLIGISQNKKSVFIPNNAKHVFLCGTTGSGKTVALSNFIKSGIDNGYPLLIIDGKGDTGKGSILDIVTQMKGNKKAYIINLNDPEGSDHYNPFKGTSADIIKDMLINMTNWTEEHYKYNTERYLQRLIWLMELSGVTVSLESLINYLPSEKFIILSKLLVEKEILTKDEHIKNMEIAKISGQIAGSAAARFSTIAESRLGKIFNENGVDIYTALEENAIILFILNPLMYPEMSPLIGRLIVIDSKKAVSKFYQNKKNRTFYIFDEINTYISTAMVDLVNKSRSANITCVLATQSLSDLNNIDGNDFLEPVVENCNNYLVLRQNSPTNAEAWAKIIGTRKTMNATYQVKGADSGELSPTDLGTLRQTWEFVYHPNVIKNLATGEAIFITKDLKYHAKIKVNKPL